MVTNKAPAPREALKLWEKLGLALLLVVMMVSTLSTAIASQQATKAAKNTDVLSSCFEPGTSCSRLLLEGGIKTTAENKCIIDSLIDIPPVSERLARRVQILHDYDLCVVYEIQQAKEALTKESTETKLKEKSK